MQGLFSLKICSLSTWGFGRLEYGPTTIFTICPRSKMIRETYQGIRPAPGYPACPEHTEKGLLWQLLNVQKNAGISITESFAMLPAASVSGIYFSHPESRYFAVGKIDEDQAIDYAKRKGMDLNDAKRWLAPNL